MFRNKGGTAEIIRPLVMKISFFYDLSRFDEGKQSNFSVGRKVMEVKDIN